MRSLTPIFLFTLATPATASCFGHGGGQDSTTIAETVIGLERAALERWGKGDPSGFLEIIADDYTYFDPYLDERVDGRAAVEVIYENIRGQVSYPRFELIDPRVQVAGDIAVLTFNFTSDPPDSAGSAVDLNDWHTTEVFRRYEGEWKLISTHWSLTRSQLVEAAHGGLLTGETPECPSLHRQPPGEGVPSLVVQLERDALDRWGAGDPGGYLEITADGYTYFDPSLDKRIDDRQAITEYLEPIRGRVSVSRYEIIEPYVQTDGTTAVLTFNLKSYGEPENSPERLGAHWHSTEIYRRAGAEWRLISTHWSYTASWLRELAGRL